MTTLVFTTGFCNSESEYVSLLAAIKSFYSGRLPAGINYLMARWNQDVLAALQPSLATTTKLVLVGFSFGGEKTVEMANQLKWAGQAIDGVVLLDPVDYHNPNTPNTVGFTLPDNVKHAWCFYRDAKAMPWSGPLRSAACEFYVKKYVPSSSDVLAAHGQYVWSGETLAAIRSIV